MRSSGVVKARITFGVIFPDSCGKISATNTPRSTVPNRSGGRGLAER